MLIIISLRVKDLKFTLSDDSHYYIIWLKKKYNLMWRLKIIQGFLLPETVGTPWLLVSLETMTHSRKFKHGVVHAWTSTSVFLPSQRFAKSKASGYVRHQFCFDCVWIQASCFQNQVWIRLIYIVSNVVLIMFG